MRFPIDISIIKKILIVLLTNLVVSCNAQDSDESSISFQQFPLEKELTTQKLFDLEGISIVTMSLYKDSILVVHQKPQPTGHHFLTYDLSTKKLVGSILSIGRKPGESIAFLSHGIFGDKLWVHDVVKKKIIFISLTGTSKEGKEVNMPYFFYWLNPLSESTFLGFGDYSSGFKFSVFDLAQQKNVDSLVPYPNRMNRAQKQDYESFVFSHPTSNKHVLAVRHADHLEFYDFEKNTDKVVKGPEDFAPDKGRMKDPVGNELSTLTEKTRFAFVRGHTTDKYVYLLYSGSKRTDENADWGKSIFVFDWEGNPIKRLNLKAGIVDFVVTSDDKTLYVNNPLTKSIEFSRRD